MYLFIQVVSDASDDRETVCQCNHLTNFALLMAEGNGGEGALAAATGGVDKGVIALQIFSYVVVVLAIICLLAVAYKVILINFNQSVTVFNVFNSSVFFPNPIGSSLAPSFLIARRADWAEMRL